MQRTCDPAKPTRWSRTPSSSMAFETVGLSAAWSAAKVFSSSGPDTDMAAPVGGLALWVDAMRGGA